MITRRGFLSRCGVLGLRGAVVGAARLSTLRGMEPRLDSLLSPALLSVFEDPPDTAKPRTRWWWFGGAVTREEITRELEFMRAAGLGGVEIQPVYPLEVDDPGRNIRNSSYFSQESIEFFRHAIRESRRLGLGIDVTLGSGWPYGGPFVPPDLAARKLRLIEREVAGPTTFSWDLSSELSDEERLVRILAARVTGEGLQSQLDLGDAAALEGADLGAGKWKILAFIDAPTKMEVKRPTVGMEGYVIDHFRRESVDLFLRSAGDWLLDQLGDDRIDGIFCDSLEVFGADWTPRMLPAFRENRGYGLEPYLLEFHDGSSPRSAALRYDVHLTLSELALQEFFEPLAQWARSRDLGCRVQAHGAMGDIIRAYGTATVPEGETIFGGDSFSVNLRHRRLASSAAHLYGKALVSAETYTWLRTPMFLVTLEMMKAATDAMFLDGINQIVNHGYPYSPPEAGQPGWTFYASTLVNHNNTWWRHYPLLAQYVARVSAVLRQGRPVNRLGLYVPLADVFSRLGPGGVHMDEEIEKQVGEELPIALRRLGYDFDLLTDHALEHLAAVEGGRLLAGQGRYSALIVPPARFMTEPAALRISEFVESGGRVVFVGSVPERPPGLGESRGTARTSVLGGIRESLRSGRPRAGGVSPYGQGLICWAPDLNAALDRLQVLIAPDFRIVESAGGGSEALSAARRQVGFVRRSLEDCEVFFVANVSADTFRLKTEFGVGHRSPVRLDPENGSSEEHLPFEFSQDRMTGARVTRVELQLDPFRSCFVVFPAVAEPTVLKGTSLRAPLSLSQVQEGIEVSGWSPPNEPAYLELLHGSRMVAQWDPAETPTVPLESGWTLILGEFPKLRLDRLLPWDQLPEGGSFSGWGVYEHSFDFRPGAEDLDWWIDLGEVHETADVFLNDFHLGSAWKRPRRLPCQGRLVAGLNRLRIEVANLWIHHVQQLPPRDLTSLKETYGIRWGTYGEVPPESLPPAGLLGPVHLIARRRISFLVTR